MDVRDVMDQIATHATAAAVAVDAGWTDVGVGFTAAKGWNVRIYYGGEVPPPEFASDRDLSGVLVGERVVVDALIPIASSGKADQRAVVGSLYLFKHELRTRITGDSQLGGDTVDLLIQPFTVNEIVFGGVRGNAQHYLQGRMEIHCSYTEYAITA